MKHSKMDFTLDVNTFAILFSLFHPIGIQAFAIELSPIVIEGNSSQALEWDAVVPAQISKKSTLTTPTTTGTLSSGLSMDQSHTVQDTGRAGSLSTLRGLGNGSNEINVEVMGVPLNGAQGGGFDLSAFPQFLFSQYSYQSGPGLGSFDPRAVAGTLQLTTWTEEALNLLGTNLRAWTSTTNAGGSVSQIAAGGKIRDQFALFAGYSDGDIKGPSGSLSGRFNLGGFKGKYHLLGSYVEAKTPGPNNSTPLSTQATGRAIPVIQVEKKLTEELLVKSTIFADYTYLEGNIVEYASYSRDHTSQLGLENAVLYNEWTLGLSYRKVDFSKLNFTAPTEHMGNLVLSRVDQIGSWTLQPSVQAVGVSRFGVLPQASMGAKLDWRSDLSSYMRWSYNRKFPTLVDRFYDIPAWGLYGNNALKPESLMTVMVGADFQGAQWGTGVQGYYQTRKDAMVSQSGRVVNQGDAWVKAVTHHLNYAPLSWLTLLHQLTLAQSEIAVTGKKFPYQAGITHALTSSIHESSSDPDWSVDLQTKAGHDRAGGTVASLPGYVSMDVAARYRLAKAYRGDFQRVEISTRIRNLSDQKTVLVEGYPLERSFTLNASVDF